MTDIREEILKGYGFDIDSIDLISEYKIGSPDLSGEELEQLLDKNGKAGRKPLITDTGRIRPGRRKNAWNMRTVMRRCCETRRC